MSARPGAPLAHATRLDRGREALTAPLFVVRPIVAQCEPDLTGREELGCEVAPRTLLAAQTLGCLRIGRGRPREMTQNTYRWRSSEGRG